MTGQLALPGQEPYRCIAADPPWKENGGGKIKRGAQRHYATLPTPEILQVMLACPEWRPAADSHLWMWMTDTYVWNGEGPWLMRELGFRAVRSWAWVKVKDDELDLDHLDEDEASEDLVQTGLGQYARGAHEHLVLGVRGHLPTPPPARRSKSVILARRTAKHSEKPAKAYRIIEAVSPGPRLEMFARAPRPGWEKVWGNDPALEVTP